MVPHVPDAGDTDKPIDLLRGFSRRFSRMGSDARGGDHVKKKSEGEGK